MIPTFKRWIMWIGMITWFSLFNESVAVLDLNPKVFASAKMFPRDAFPTPSFDKDAPFCAIREPCGFYSFSLNGNIPFKWVKSWCQCSPDSECVYERSDMKMRVFRQICVPMSNRDSKSKFPPAEEVDAVKAGIATHHPKSHHSHRHHKSKAEQPGDKNITRFVSVDKR